MTDRRKAYINARADYLLAQVLDARGIRPKNAYANMKKLSDKVHLSYAAFKIDEALGRVPDGYVDIALDHMQTLRAFNGVPLAEVAAALDAKLLADNVSERQRESILEQARDPRVSDRILPGLTFLTVKSPENRETDRVLASVLQTGHDMVADAVPAHHTALLTIIIPDRSTFSHDGAMKNVQNTHTVMRVAGRFGFHSLCPPETDGRDLTHHFSGSQPHPSVLSCDLPHALRTAMPTEDATRITSSSKPLVRSEALAHQAASTIAAIFR